MNAVVLNRFDPADESGDNPLQVDGGFFLDGEQVTASADKLNNSSYLKWIDVAATAALLDGGGVVPVIAGDATKQYKVRHIKLVGGGTNFGAGGDRNISLTDGTTVFTTIDNADIEAAPAATLDWGNAKVPYLTGTSNTKTVADQALHFAYSGGTTDHSTGSITFSVCVEVFPV